MLYLQPHWVAPDLWGTTGPMCNKSYLFHHSPVAVAEVCLAIKRTTRASPASTLAPKGEMSVVAHQMSGPRHL